MNEEGEWFMAAAENVFLKICTERGAICTCR